MDELLKRLAEIKAEATELTAGDTTAEVLEKLRALQVERVELDAKIAEQRAADAEAAEIAAQLSTDPEAPEEETPAEEGAPAEEPAEEEAPTEAPAEEEAPEDVAEVVVEPEAAVAEAIAAAANSPQNIPNRGDSTVKGLPIIASSASTGLGAGKQMEADDFGSVHRLAAKSGEGTHKYATIQRLEDNNPVSDRNSSIHNSVIMSTNRAAQAQALTAAACFCGPFDTKKEIETIGLNDRPVQGLFRTVPVTGPFNYIRELTLGDVTAGVNQWECSDQAGVVSGTPSTWKPCVDLTCETPVQVDPYAVVACGRVSTYQQLSHPELVDDFIAKLGIRYARVAEQLLLDELRASSTTLTYAAASQFGLLWQLEQILAHIAGIASYGQRINWSDYALILPPGAIEALIVDEHLRGFSRGANESGIMEQLRAIGVGQIVQSLDVDSTAEADYTAAIGTYVSPGATVAFDPCTAIGTWTAYVVPVSSYTVGLSPMVEAGWTRDSDLIRQNLVQYFEEGLEFIEKVNDVPSYTLELTGAGNGVTSALSLPAAC